MTDLNFETAIARMDALNAKDPGTTRIGDTDEPTALLYAKRMSQTAAELFPDAAETLRLAARAQHIERWAIPRDTYPQGRAGYHRWRNDLKKRHANTAAQIMKDSGYSQDVIETVSDLIAKKNLTSDPQAQSLEDIACIVFFKHYAVDFAQKHKPEKVAHIVAKTWNKMSPVARTAALNLDLPSGLQTQLNSLAAQEKA